MTYQRLSVSKKRLTLNLCDLVLIPNKTNDFCPTEDDVDGQDKKANQTNVASTNRNENLPQAKKKDEKSFGVYNLSCWLLSCITFAHIILNILYLSCYFPYFSGTSFCSARLIWMTNYKFILLIIRWNWSILAQKFR